ncbi:hypothetical protein M427DRAFT_154100 [Gonapodya prolifera JEL478]|uniref:Uncharacterized protein n=1 Tax=Gonapodya prolifera (strain JEL478) TaxID=1344416 RepID=A0A139AJL8_GONPJ|nr:hypothetical protein M427DRAFT_154100 [Gonapodya prolifera JEL478]|eukprot:KXS16961.1 hypothetical protein M427DRAFT_154100 [Gonapodya prolifera JEL478]
MAIPHSRNTTILKSIHELHENSIDELDGALDKLKEALLLKARAAPGKRSMGVVEDSRTEEDVGNSTLVEQAASLQLDPSPQGLNVNGAGFREDSPNRHRISASAWLSVEDEPQGSRTREDGADPLSGDLLNVDNDIPALEVSEGDLTENFHPTWDSSLVVPGTGVYTTELGRSREASASNSASNTPLRARRTSELLSRNAEISLAPRPDPNSAKQSAKTIRIHAALAKAKGSSRGDSGFYSAEASAASHPSSPPLASTSRPHRSENSSASSRLALADPSVHHELLSIIDAQLRVAAHALSLIRGERERKAKSKVERQVRAALLEADELKRDLWELKVSEALNQGTGTGVGRAAIHGHWKCDGKCEWITKVHGPSSSGNLVA